MSKQDIRNQLTADLDAFLKTGGTITIGSTTKKRKPKMTVSGSQKPFFSWSEPKDRPSNSWDSISTAD